MKLVNKMSMSVLVLAAAVQVASAAPQETADTLTFPANSWYQVEKAWPDSGVVCTSADGPVCQLEPGDYKWLQSMDGGAVEEGFFTATSTGAAGSYSIELITETCVSDPSPPVGSEMCKASCPSGAVASGGACGGEYTLSGNQLPAPTSAQASATDFSCAVPSIGSPVELITVTAQVYCVSATSTAN